MYLFPLLFYRVFHYYLIDENIAVGKENQEAFEECINDDAKTREKPYYPRGGLSVKCGDVANFHIRVIARRHSSLQGTISQWGQDVLKTAPFRSALELLYLLRSTLEKCEEADQEKDRR